jgi:hypothetical protein
VCRHRGAPSPRCFCGDALPTVPQNCLRLLARDALECFQEIIEREPVREVIEQCLNWQARPAKDRRASQDAGIGKYQSAGGSFDFRDSTHESEANPVAFERQACAAATPDLAHLRPAHRERDPGRPFPGGSLAATSAAGTATRLVKRRRSSRGSPIAGHEAGDFVGEHALGVVLRRITDHLSRVGDAPA